LNISKNRKLEIENPQIFVTYRQKLGGFEDEKQLELFLVNEPEIEYERSLMFD
jgi:site-specific DNA-methyltransferase (adenine-specific)